MIIPTKELVVEGGTAQETTGAQGILRWLRALSGSTLRAALCFCWKNPKASKPKLQQNKNRTKQNKNRAKTEQKQNKSRTKRNKATHKNDAADILVGRPEARRPAIERELYLSPLWGPKWIGG